MSRRDNCDLILFPIPPLLVNHYLDEPQLQIISAYPSSMFEQQQKVAYTDLDLRVRRWREIQLESYNHSNDLKFEFYSSDNEELT